MAYDWANHAVVVFGGRGKLYDNLEANRRLIVA